MTTIIITPEAQAILDSFHTAGDGELTRIRMIAGADVARALPAADQHKDSLISAQSHPIWALEGIAARLERLGYKTSILDGNGGYHVTYGHLVVAHFVIARNNLERFRDAYTEALTAAVAKYPGEYIYGAAEVPAVVEKMLPALASGTANIGPAVKAAARKLKIRHTITEIKKFLAAGVVLLAVGLGGCATVATPAPTWPACNIPLVHADADRGPWVCAADGCDVVCSPVSVSKGGK